MLSNHLYEIRKIYFLKEPHWVYWDLLKDCEVQSEQEINRIYRQIMWDQILKFDETHTRETNRVKDEKSKK